MGGANRERKKERKQEERGKKKKMNYFFVVVCLFVLNLKIVGRGSSGLPVGTSFTMALTLTLR